MTAGAAAPQPLLVVAVDGPSAAGKGTLGRGIARHFGLAFLDTGLLYRAVGARLLAGGQNPADARAAEAAAKALQFSELDSPALRDDAVARVKAICARDGTPIPDAAGEVEIGEHAERLLSECLDLVLRHANGMCPADT